MINEIEACADRVTACIEELLQNSDHRTHHVWDAMRYSALGGGKRIRPYLTATACAAMGGNGELATRFGAAVEMVHTYSLIHDDLPCMDNDDYRRGKQTCHKAFGEATALLAGDGLLTHSFEVITTAADATDRQKAEAVRVLSGAAGCRGMIGGQMMDLDAERQSISFESLRALYDGKTAALFRAATALGCIAAGVFDGAEYDALSAYSTHLGLCFQIVDDLLDVYGDERLGKPLGSDEKNGKNTYLSFMTREEAEHAAADETRAAKDALAGIPGCDGLLGLADQLLKRRK